VTTGIVLIFGGAVLGIPAGWAVACALMAMGLVSHDVYTAFAGAILGAPAGAVALPTIVWWRGRRRRRAEVGR
jgi:hypothetical protein